MKENRYIDMVTAESIAAIMMIGCKVDKHFVA